MTSMGSNLEHGTRKKPLTGEEESSILENQIQGTRSVIFNKKPVMIGHCTHCVNEEICKYKEEALELEAKAIASQADTSKPFRLEMKCRLFKNNTLQDEILKKRRDFIGEY